MLLWLADAPGRKEIIGMNKQKACAPTLFLGVWVLFSGCLGQTSRDNAPLENRREHSQLGKPVDALGDRILVVFQDSRQHYWFAGGDEGAYRYDQKRLVLFTTEDGLPTNRVIGIQEDQQGKVYFDTPSGVSQFDGSTFKTLPVADAASTDQAWRLEPDDLWFRMGWDSEGPYRYAGQSLIPLRFPKPEQAFAHEARYPDAAFSPYGIYSIYRDRQGAIWFGTAALGVCRFDGESMGWIYEEDMTTTPEGGALGIRSTFEDQKGHFWFTHTRHRYQIMPGYSDRNGTRYLNYKRVKGVGATNKQGEATHPYYMSMAEDGQGHLWMATYAEGVWHNDGEKLTHYPVKDGDEDVLLFSIYTDQHGVLWLGTHHAGVYRFNGHTFEKFSL